MTAITPEDLPGKCPCCGGDIHDPNDLIEYRIFYPGPEVPKTDLIEAVCDICGETRPKKRKPIAARILYRRAVSRKFLREDYRCEECFDVFLERHPEHRQYYEDNYCKS
jgi:hypothetical protein